MDRELELRMIRQGVKPTAMRLLVYRELERSARPLSLKELEERMPTADRSTIFRTLTLFLQHHLIHGIEDGSGALRYEMCTSENPCAHDDQHGHFYCEQCQRTFCLHGLPVPRVTLPEGFLVTAANLMIKGICPECRRIRYGEAGKSPGHNPDSHSMCRKSST